MDLLKRMEIERACTRLNSEYSLYVDTGRVNDFLDLFMTDGSWVLAGLPPMQGREQMNGYFAERDPKTRSRHVVSNVLIDVVDDRTARGSSYATVYRHVGDERTAPMNGPIGVAVYTDEFRLTDKGWKFQRREAAMAFVKKA
jgi:hypothetical protein